MHLPTRPHSRALALRRVAPTLAVPLVAALLTGVMVDRATDAAFSATTSNPSSSFDTLQIALSDNDSSSALFSLTDLDQSDSATACIRVTYTSTVASTVKVHGDGLMTDSGTLGDWLDVTIEEGSDSGGSAALACATFTPDGAAVYSGDLTTLDATTTFAGGYGTWAPASTATKDYRVTVTLNASTPNAQQGQSISGFNLVWTAESA